MNEVNRSFIVVHAKEPFLQWINSLPDPGNFTLDEVNRDSTAKEWFDVDFHSIVSDLVEKPLKIFY